MEEVNESQIGIAFRKIAASKVRTKKVRSQSQLVSQGHLNGVIKSHGFYTLRKDFTIRVYIAAASRLCEIEHERVYSNCKSGNTAVLPVIDNRLNKHTLQLSTKLLELIRVSHFLNKFLRCFLGVERSSIKNI